MRCVGFGFEGATSGSVSAHGRLDVLALQHRSSQGEKGSEAGGRSCPRGQDPNHPRGIEGRRRVVSVSVSAEGASVFVTADSLSSREAAQQGIAVGQCKRRKRLVAMDVVFCMFSALIKRAVESHTAEHGVVSFDQVQVNFQLAEALGPEE
ncbi:hypothetical protein LA080_002953 [Diaporthe eres]|nr:hypothetical protein LA080_002953 [Diaporthe eres]